jgi:organic radical activating enzyme
MFNLDNFYKAAVSGKALDVDGLISHLGSFRNLYIWGAGNLGKEVGAKLRALGVTITAYWDSRASTLCQLDGVEVIEPFFTTGSREETAVVFCITSSFVKDHCLRELSRHGFGNQIKGDLIYAGLVCDLNEVTQFKSCRDATACDVYTCEKNEVFHKRLLGLQDGADQLYFKNITFVISQKCTLQCKYCYSYTNAYPAERRVNFPVSQILSDIDRTFDCIEGVKIVPLIGGETFLHPDLSTIVKRFLEKRNFGVLNVTTNGIVKIDERQLEALQDSRIQVVFSNYKTALSSRQRDLFDSNVELVQSSGAQVIVLNETPQWTVPTTLWDRSYPLEVMEEKRRACQNPLVCKYVKNGKFFPCTVADSVHSIGIAQYPEDYVALDPEATREQIREGILTLLRRSYFGACRHCDGICGTTGVTATAGEQGYYEVKQP